ncbi:unnamed protein product [Cuscuta epithymum]|uniref:Uncharacterized protein n=1 Tax=Cuscuta epithymum TaxID=186058 RepID=A0AAV0GC43_9ASTE|nr:unnamed protein product [Cuscuta epithymum]
MTTTLEKREDSPGKKPSCSPYCRTASSPEEMKPLTSGPPLPVDEAAARVVGGRSYCTVAVTCGSEEYKVVSKIKLNASNRIYHDSGKFLCQSKIVSSYYMLIMHYVIKCEF